MKTVQAQNMTRGQNNNFQSHNSSTQTLQAQNISKGINTRAQEEWSYVCQVED